MSKLQIQRYIFAITNQISEISNTLESPNSSLETVAVFIDHNSESTGYILIKKLILESCCNL